MKNKISENKKAQITIFVIAAIVIVALIAGGFLLARKPAETPSVSAPENPRAFIAECVLNSGEKEIKNLVESGGFLNPEKSYAFNKTKIPYLCYSAEKDELCINEHPMLNKEIEKEILNLLNPKIEKCFSDLKSELAKYNYKEEGKLNSSVSIIEDKIVISSSLQISYTKGEQIYNIDSFTAKMSSPAHDFIMLANKIINQEVSCDCERESCNADIIQLSLENRDFEISKPVYASEGTEVYSIKEIQEGREFNFAIRNCAQMEAER